MIDTIIAINASLIKKFFFKGDALDICPKKIYAIDILKTDHIQTINMLRGNYFECGCIGKGYDGKITDDLPRKKLTKKQNDENLIAESYDNHILKKGEKKISQTRIDEQISIFHRECLERNISIRPDNTQTKIYKKLSNGILISGILDIFPVHMTINNEDKLFIIDLKLTGDINNTYGKYCWGAQDMKERMDHIQADMYNELVLDIDYSINPHLKTCLSDKDKEALKNHDYTFVYWLFDYEFKNDLLNNRFIISHYDEQKQAELYEVIRKTNSLIEYYDKEGWPAIPNYEKCKDCPLDCDQRCQIQVI